MTEKSRSLYSERLPDGRIGVFQGQRPPARAGRSRQARWDRQHMRTVSCRIRSEQYERFKAACRMRGETPYQVLQSAILRRIGDR